VNKSVQKAGILGIPGCVENAFALWDAIRKAKETKGDLTVTWLDLANAYGSVLSDRDGTRTLLVPGTR